MKTNPYLSFDGTCAEAFRFYEGALHGRMGMMMTYGQSPMADQTPPGARDRVMHAQVTVGDVMIMGSDSPPGRHEPMSGFHVSLMFDEPAEAERTFAALAEGGAERMPLQETFWAHRFGTLVDRFGTPWMVNCMKTPG